MEDDKKRLQHKKKKLKDGKVIESRLQFRTLSSKIDIKLSWEQKYDGA